jgi:hypothetical protein
MKQWMGMKQSVISSSHEGQLSRNLIKINLCNELCFPYTQMLIHFLYDELCFPHTQMLIWLVYIICMA